MIQLSDGYQPSSEVHTFEDKVASAQALRAWRVWWIRVMTSYSSHISVQHNCHRSALEALVLGTVLPVQQPRWLCRIGESTVKDLLVGRTNHVCALPLARSHYLRGCKAHRPESTCGLALARGSLSMRVWRGPGVPSLSCLPTERCARA